METWTKEAIFYHLYPLGFCGAPQFHQEQIEHRIIKIKEWIPHMQEMGFNAVYLGPVFESYEHGYDTSDYQMIDHRLGTNEDFKEVCNALHAHGIRIILDGVFNHVGRAFWAFKDVQQRGQDSPYGSWFHNINFNNHSPLGDAFSYEAWEGHYNLVKLNLRNEDVVAYLLESVGMWMQEFQIDGLRLDAADCIDRNFFRSLKQYCSEKDSNFWLMGEIIHGDYNIWANNEMLDTVTNYECYKGLYSSHNEKNYFEIAYSLNRQFGNGGIYKDLHLYNFVDNHDVNRLASTVKHKEDLANIYTMLYTIPGIPSIYYGSEWALRGKKHDGSDADIRPNLNLIDLPPCELSEHIAKLGILHKKLSPLCYGSYEQVLVRNEQFVFKRKEGQQEVYVLFNVSEEPCECEISTPFKTARDALSAQIYECKDAKLSLVLAPKSAYILAEASDCNDTEIRRTVITNAQDKIAHPEYSIMNTAETLQQELVQETPQANTIRPGVYEHFKGNRYAVLYVAKHSETQEGYVVYRQLYGEENVWVRPLTMFLEKVKLEGKIIPRFTYLGK